jgi:hypothetical protein
VWRDVLSSKGSVCRGLVMVLAEGSSSVGSDADWSNSDQVSLGVGRQRWTKGTRWVY